MVKVSASVGAGTSRLELGKVGSIFAAALRASWEAVKTPSPWCVKYERRSSSVIGS